METFQYSPNLDKKSKLYSKRIQEYISVLQFIISLEEDSVYIRESADDKTDIEGIPSALFIEEAETADVIASNYGKNRIVDREAAIKRLDRFLGEELADAEYVYKYIDEITAIEREIQIVSNIYEAEFLNIVKEPDGEVYSILALHEGRLKEMIVRDSAFRLLNRYIEER